MAHSPSHNNWPKSSSFSFQPLRPTTNFLLSHIFWASSSSVGNLPCLRSQLPREKSETTQLHRMPSHDQRKGLITMSTMQPNLQPPTFLAWYVSETICSKLKLRTRTTCLLCMSVFNINLCNRRFWRSFQLKKWDYYATDSWNVATKVNVPWNRIGWPWCWDSPT